MKYTSHEYNEGTEELTVHFADQASRTYFPVPPTVERDLSYHGEFFFNQFIHGWFTEGHRKDTQKG